MPQRRYNETANIGYRDVDTFLPGRGLQEALILVIAFGVTGVFFGLGLSALFAPTLAQVPGIIAACYGILQTTGALFSIVWFMAAHGYVKRLHQGLMPDPEPELPQPNYDQPYQNPSVRIIPAYHSQLLPPPLPAPAEGGGPWEPSSDDIREFVMGWRARGGHQQHRWNGYRLASGVTLNPYRWQLLCKPLREAGILNNVDERITGDLALTPEQICEQLGL